ncbi:MAG: AAA family ATPase, partial [Myxococcales bacterium]|nr:AAA family ATPase [Myxococcales bacterium]
MTRPSLARLLGDHRAVVCVGTGGVGKTTLAAALGLAAAMAGRRAMVLTIDPAQQLARALGLSALRREGEPVPEAALADAGITLRGSLSAGMLDQKTAWDAFIARQAPSPKVRDTLLDNAFYRELSTSLAGSHDYMAIEELCRLDESGDYDLIVVDTPPAQAAIDFIRAPDRMQELLDPRVAGLLARSFGDGSGRWGGLSSLIPLVLFRLERAFGTRALREIAAFFVALEAVFGDVAARAARARHLLRSDTTAFVLVTGPSERVLAGGDALAGTMRALGVPLRATIVNRVHPAPELGEHGDTFVDPLLAELAAA